MSAKGSDENRKGGRQGRRGETPSRQGRRGETHESSRLQSGGKKVVRVARVVKEGEEAAADAAKGGTLVSKETYTSVKRDLLMLAAADAAKCGRVTGSVAGSVTGSVTGSTLALSIRVCACVHT